MSSTNVLSITIPQELQQRLEREAQHQGTTVSQLTTYLLTTQLTQLETIYSLDSKLANKTIPNLKSHVADILNKIPDRPVPEWDSLEK